MERRKSTCDKYNKNTHEWEEEDLDEEMEEIFHNDHFSLADLVERTSEATRNIDENDFELHRRESFQYHQPLHKLYHHKHKKSHHKSEKDGSEKSPRHAMSTVSEEPVAGTSKDKEPSEDEPLLSQDAAVPDSLGTSKAPDTNDKVQFYVGSSTSLENAASSKKPLKNKKHEGFMPYHQTQSVQLKASISDSLKNQILVLIGNTVINYRDTLVSLGYSLAQNAHNNQEAAKILCGAAEVVYDGFKGDNETMTKYQNETLGYSDASLMVTIFNNLIRGVNVLEDEENPDNLDSVAILGEIRYTYDGQDFSSSLL